MRLLTDKQYQDVKALSPALSSEAPWTLVWNPSDPSNFKVAVTEQPRKKSLQELKLQDLSDEITVIASLGDHYVRLFSAPLSFQIDEENEAGQESDKEEGENESDSNETT